MPKSQGRSNTQIVEDRQKEAQVVELRKAGHTFTRIATALGYADESGARYAYRRALDRYLAPEVEEYRALHNLRLDELWSRWYPKAIGGLLNGRQVEPDRKALDACLVIMRRQAQMNGLDAPSRLNVQVSDEFNSEITKLLNEMNALADVAARQGLTLNEQHHADDPGSKADGQ